MTEKGFGTDLIALFYEFYETEPFIVSRAPGRLEWFGNHTDYAGGIVGGVATDICTYIGFRPGADGRFRIVSSLQRKVWEGIFCGDPVQSAEYKWVNYLLGVLTGFEEKGFSLREQGADIAVYGELPIGAGVSTSASLEVAFAFCLNEYFQAGLSKWELALLSKKAENEFAGVGCGILDQGVVALAEADHFVKIDCSQDGVFEVLPCGLKGIKLAVIHCGVSHQLDSGFYNQLTEDCANAFRVINEMTAKDLAHLSDAGMEDLENAKSRLSGSEFKRAKHVILSCSYASKAVKNIMNGNVSEFGAIVQDQYQTLRDNHGVAVDAMDRLVTEIRDRPGVLAVNMMGGGGGGAAFAMVEAEKADSLIDYFRNIFFADREQKPEIFITTIGSGPVVLKIGDQG